MQDVIPTIEARSDVPFSTILHHARRVRPGDEFSSLEILAVTLHDLGHLQEEEIATLLELDTHRVARACAYFQEWGSKYTEKPTGQDWMIDLLWEQSVLVEETEIEADLTRHREELVLVDRRERIDEWALEGEL